MKLYWITTWLPHFVVLKSLPKWCKEKHSNVYVKKEKKKSGCSVNTSLGIPRDADLATFCGCC